VTLDARDGQGHGDEVILTVEGRRCTEKRDNAVKRQPVPRDRQSRTELRRPIAGLRNPRHAARGRLRLSCSVCGNVTNNVKGWEGVRERARGWIWADALDTPSGGAVSGNSPCNSAAD